MKRIILKIILWTWCFPQTFLGLLIFLFFKSGNRIIKQETYKNIDVKITNDIHFGGISLGNYIILDKNVKKELNHEYGHTIQSYILGPIYLIIIGVPSYFLFTFFKKSEKYHKYFPENWADKLGKVIRK